MKKVIFMLAFVLMSSLSFANNKNTNYKKMETASFENFLNEISYEKTKITKTNDFFGTCNVYVTFYGEDGENLGTYTLTFEDVSSQEECDSIADEVAELLE